MTSKPDQQPYLRRRVETALAAALKDTLVVCVLGPRQCGKSTLAIHQDTDRAYVSLDDPNYFRLASADPKGFKGLKRLADQAGKDFQGGIVLYDGTSVLPIDRALNIYAVPFSKLWEL
jgi:hypothetical protein